MRTKPNAKGPNAKCPNDRRRQPYKSADPAAAITADFDRKRALQLRLEGYTFRDIAVAIGVSLETAHRYVNDSWDRLNEENDVLREEYRAIELARLDALLKMVFPMATKQNLKFESVELGPDGPCIMRKEDAILQLKAVDRVIHISKRRSDLLGLDAPTQVQAAGTHNNLEPLDVLAKRVAEARARSAGAPN